MTAPVVVQPGAEDTEPVVTPTDPDSHPGVVTSGTSPRPTTSLPSGPPPIRPDATTAPTSATSTTAPPAAGKTAQPGGNTAPSTAPAGGPAGKADTKTDPAKTDPTKTTTPDATKADPKADTKSDGAKTDPKTAANPSDSPKTDTDAAKDPAAATPPHPDLSSLANMAPSLVNPLLNSAMAIPASLAGMGQMVPSMFGSVMPTLAALLSQLGSGPTPAAPAARLTGAPDTLPGMGDLAGTGDAADTARTATQVAVDQSNALRAVEAKLGQVLGMSSLNTETARRAVGAIISEVEGAVRAAAVQGNTPEAQALVLGAMRRAVEQAGSVVSTAARDKMTDAAFVRSLIGEYLTIADGGGPVSGGGSTHLQAGSSGRGAKAVAAARRALGLPYVWGGGGALGPTGGGFDCSGLTQYAIAKATGGRLILPRTTYDQIHSGRAVALSALRPGDLVFSNFSRPGVPEHVQLYIGGGQVIEAPQRGVPVQISAVPGNAQARRVL